MSAQTHKPKFLQVHTLHSYAAALLNRDDANLSKTLPYGGHTRTRISSQCLKRHWRTADDDWALANIPGADGAVRSRDLVDRRIVPRLDTDGVSTAVLNAVTEGLNTGLYGNKGALRKDRQPLLLGHPEINFLTRNAQVVLQQFPDDGAKAAKAVASLFKESGSDGKNLRAFRQATQLPGGLDAALFGRMITSDPDANIDAAIHVAHALTVHEQERDADYFSVVDDLTTLVDNTGAAHIGSSELTSGIFYGFVVVDLAALVSNLEGVAARDYQQTPSELAATVIEHLLHLITKVTPGARKGSTAPYSHAEFLMTELGSRQPRSLMPAFRNPSKPDVSDALTRLTRYLDNLDAAYGAHETRYWLATENGFKPETGKAKRLPLEDLASRSTSLLAR